MTNCRDCKHWTPQPGDTTLRDKHPCRILSDDGTTTSYDTHTRPRGLLVESHAVEGVTMFTDAEFGCAHGEMIEAQS